MFSFQRFDYLTDGEIDLLISERLPADNQKGYVPAYKYHITLHGLAQPIGSIDIRIGNNENTYYGGHIGYRIDPEYRGHGYASKACLIIKQVALAHEMTRLTITCNPDNFASRRTCEKAGLTLQKIVDLPTHNEMYRLGERQKCIYEWNLAGE